jgi:hypothetical protein
MKTCLLIFTDGRDDYLERTFQSFSEKLDWQFDYVIMTDDSGDQGHADALKAKYKNFRGTEIWHRFNGERLGFARTIAEAWKAVPGDTEYVLHCEDDFLLNRYLDLGQMIEVMKLNPHLVQIALMRQPWNEEEKKHGGIWQWRSTLGVEFKQQSMMSRFGDLYWFEHCAWMTTNPCLYPRWVSNHGWPTDEGAGEGKIMRELLAEDPRRRSAYWGRMEDPPIVEHIGYGRKGTGY